MKKPPANIDCVNIGIDPDSIKTETVLYDGPTRGICPKFPRNVNTHASIGPPHSPCMSADLAARARRCVHSCVLTG